MWRQGETRSQYFSPMPWLLFLVLLFPLPFSAQQPMTWTWTAELVDVQGFDTTLDVDSAGNVHMAYRIADRGVLKYAFRPADSGRWFTMKLDETLFGFYAKLVLDPQGNPHICYTPREIKYAAWDGKEWRIQRIDRGVAEYTCSVVIAPDGTPHITWYQSAQDGAAYYHIKYAVLQAGSWVTRTIDYDGEAGKWSSVGLDSRGHPHVAYTQFPRGELRYAFWNGDRWNLQIVDSPYFGKSRVTRGMGNSLMIDAEGKILLSYLEDDSLKYAKLQNGRWDIQQVDRLQPKGSWRVSRSSLALDQRGYPHIGYEDTLGLRHAYWDGEQWRIQIIAPGVGDSNFHSSMAIGRDGTLYIGFRNPADGSVMVAIGRPSEPVQRVGREGK